MIGTADVLVWFDLCAICYILQFFCVIFGGKELTHVSLWFHDQPCVGCYARWFLKSAAVAIMLISEVAAADQESWTFFDESSATFGEPYVLFCGGDEANTMCLSVGCFDNPLNLGAEVVDLNRDGQPEVFLSIGGTCMSGNIGSWFELYIKDRGGRWQKQFGMPGIYSVLTVSHSGFPDIDVGGSGFCFSVFRWDGRRYRIYKRCP